MRGSIFGLRSASNSIVGSPAQTPVTASAGSRPDSGIYVTDVEPLSLPPSVAPDTSTIHRARPLTRLSLTAFRKPSPARRPRDTAANNQTPVPTPPSSPAPGAAGVGSVSYLDALSLKLGEAVSKALLPPPVQQNSISGMTKAVHIAANHDTGDALLKGKKPLPAGRGRALGGMIANELQSASQDSFLHRAVLRLLQRPLSVLLTNLTTQVTNLILSPDFAYASSVFPLNPTHIHALALAHFASELLETFDLLKLGQSSPRNAGDGLRPDREALESVVSKVVGAFLSIIKQEVHVAITEAESDAAAFTQVEKVLTRAAPILGRVTFAGESGQSRHVQSMLATLEIGAIWRCLTTLADRHMPRSHTCLTVPEETSGEVRRSVSAGELRSLSGDTPAASHNPQANYVNHLPSYVTPPDTPQMPPHVISEKDTGPDETRDPSSQNEKSVQGNPLLSKAPSPPANKKLSIPKLASIRPLTTRSPSLPQVPMSTSEKLSPTTSAPFRLGAAPEVLMTALRGLAHDSRSVVSAIKRLPPPLEGGLARDAVDEAFKEMTGFLTFIDYLAGDGPTSGSLESRLQDIHQLMPKTRETPMLLALPVLLRIALALPTTPQAIADVAPDVVSGWIGISEYEYRQTCLNGFRNADECASIVGKAFLKNKMTGCLDWMRAWVEKSTVEEEEDSSDDEARG